MLFADKTEITKEQAVFLAQNAPSKELFVAYEGFDKGVYDSGCSVRGLDDLKRSLPKHKNHKVKFFK